MLKPTGMSLRLAAAWCAGLVALAGCAGDPEPPGTVPSKAAPSPTSSSPSPTPQTIEEEVEAFVRDYYAELTRAARTGDASRLRTMTTKGCPCYRAARVIERGAQQGERAVGIEWKIQSLRVHDLTFRTSR